MLATRGGDYLYGGLRSFIDAETTYVNARQQSSKANLPKTALWVADNVFFAIKGATAVVVLGYGAPLPVTALATLSLLPSNTFSYLADKAKASISRLSNKFSEWYYGDEEYDKNKQLNLNTSYNNYNNLVSGLETAQYVVTNGLALYKNLLPVNWLKIIAVEAVAPPLRWCNGGVLPEYYTNNAISDWVWTLSGVAGDVIQSHRLLRNTTNMHSLSADINQRFNGNCLSIVNVTANSYNAVIQQAADLGKHLSIVDAKYAASVMPFVIAGSLGGGLKNNFMMFGNTGVNISLASLTMLQMLEAVQLQNY